jgi:hypothetical protein
MLQLTHYNPGFDKPQLRIGTNTSAGVAQYYYDIGRSNTGTTAGRLLINGNQTGFTGVDTNGDVYASGAVRGQACQLTDGATITVTPRCGNHHYVTIAGNRTFEIASMTADEQTRADGQRITIEIKQDGTGSRTCTLTTGPGQFGYGTDITGITCSTVAGKYDVLTAMYSKRENKWFVLDFKKGY